MKLRPFLFLLLVTSLGGWESQIAHLSPGGRLIYSRDAAGNRIPDFSYAGYRNGDEPIPDVPVVMTMGPVEGDNTAQIQTALNAVGALAPDLDGFRGALLLEPGEYEIWGTLRILDDGVVLRGSGDGADPATSTILRGMGNSPSQRTILIAGGGSNTEWAQEETGTRQDILTDTIFVAENSFEVANAALYTPGDNIVIYHPCSSGWLEAIDFGGTHSGESGAEPGVDIPWEVGSVPIVFNRRITAIDGNRITVDVPFFNRLVRSESQSYIYRYLRTGIRSRIGVENLRIDIETEGGTSENHAWNAVDLFQIEDAWVRGCTFLHFGFSGVRTATATQITVEDCNAWDPVSIIEGGKRYNFQVYRASQQILFQDCSARNGRHHYVSNGISSTSGIVFLNCTSEGAYTSSEGHRRWSQGLLFDNHVELDGPRPGLNPRLLGLYNRGFYGTSHGWAAVNSVAWNSDVHDGRMVIQKPPTAQNYAIGCSGNEITGQHPPVPFDELEGYIEGSNTPGLEPVSLYEQQLFDRQHPQPRYSLTLATVGNGELMATPPSADGQYDSAMVVTLTPQAGEHWTFDHWEGDLSGDVAPIEVQILGDLNVTAVFDSILTRYHVDLGVVGQGTVLIDPESLDGMYDSSQVITVTALPATHWLFDHWQGDISGSVNPEVLTVLADLDLTAVFDSIEARFNLTVNINGAGSVLLDPEPPADGYDSTTVVTLTPQPGIGYRFSHWYGDYAGTEEIIELTMDRDHTVWANFIPNSSGNVLLVNADQDLREAVNLVNESETLDSIYLETAAGAYTWYGGAALEIRKDMGIGGNPDLPPTIYLSDPEGVGYDILRLYEDLDLSDVVLDGGFPGSSGPKYGIRMKNTDELPVPPGTSLHARNVTFQRFHYQNDPAADGHAFKMDLNVVAGEVRFEDCRFEDIGHEAIRISETQNFETERVLDSLIVENCTFRDIDSEGIRYYGDADSTTADPVVRLQHLTFQNTATRVVFLKDSPGAILRDLIIADSRLSTHGRDADLLVIQGTGSSVAHVDTHNVRPVSMTATDGGMVRDSTVWGMDPLFTDAEAGDLSLLPASHAYEHGHDGEALGDLRWAVNEPTQIWFEITVQGAGRVLADPPPTGLTWDAETQLTLTAIPDSGWSFQHWGGSIFGNQNPVTWPLHQDGFVVATFQQLSGTGETGLPTEYALSNAYPNPFNPGTRLRLALPEKATVTLVLFDNLGRRILEQQLHELPAGTHDLHVLLPPSTSSGVYLLHLQADSFSTSKKLLLLR